MGSWFVAGSWFVSVSLIIHSSVFLVSLALLVVYLVQIEIHLEFDIGVAKAINYKHGDFSHIRFIKIRFLPPTDKYRGEFVFKLFFSVHKLIRSRYKVVRRMLPSTELSQCVGCSLHTRTDTCTPSCFRVSILVVV